MKTNHPIHPEWLSITQTRFYSYLIAGWVVHVEPDGSFNGEKGISMEKVSEAKP